MDLELQLVYSDSAKIQCLSARQENEYLGKET